MSSASDVAAGFSISGLLDADAKTRSKYPVAELDIDAIEDNPANAVYSMEEAAIEALAESIEKDGLTDLPLVRKLTDGRWQLISGHRRRAARREMHRGDSSRPSKADGCIGGVFDPLISK